MKKLIESKGRSVSLCAPEKRYGKKQIRRLFCVVLTLVIAATALLCPAAPAFAAELGDSGDIVVEEPTAAGDSGDIAVAEPAAGEATDDGQPDEEIIAPFTVSLEKVKAPSGELVLGGAFGISGVITSEKIIAKVFGGIYTADGEKVIYHEVEPDSVRCDIYQSFDAVMAFGSLPIGSYIFKIEATDNDSQTVTAVRSEFSVVDGVIPSEISATGISLPADQFPQGSVFSIRGIVTSTYRLAKVWGGVYNSDGTKTDVYYEDSPNLALYDLNATFDRYLGFRGLSVGSYIYKIEATDVRGLTRIVAEKSFDIVEEGSAPSDIQIYGATYPTGTLMQGKGFSIKGAIFSSYTIETISGGIYKAEGSTGDYDGRYAMDDISVGAKSFNLSKLDSGIKFGDLPVGEYVYKVIVTDERGQTTELVNSAFCIKSAERTDESPQVVMNGMDVSAYQEEIDFEKVFDDGIDFVILRAGVTNNGDANYHQDAKFEEHYADANNAGLKVGVYLYTSAINKSEMKADVDGLIETLGGKNLDMPVYIDIEASRQSSLGKETLTELVKYGCELLAAKGYKAGVYASYNWIRDYIDVEQLGSTDCEIWVAYWPEDPDSYDLSGFCLTWQYTDKGKVDGIAGGIDKNYRYAALSVEKFAVKIAQALGGSVISDKQSAGFGERVTVNVTPDAGYDLKSVRLGDIEQSIRDDGKYAFLMPNGDVTFTAEFEKYIHIFGKEPSCTQDGNIEYYIDLSGRRYTLKDGVYTEFDGDVVIAAAGHDWSEWDQTQPGVNTRTCLNCGEIETEEIPATEPDPAPEIDPAKEEHQSSGSASPTGGAPGTGDSGAALAVSFALMLISLAAVFCLAFRREISE